MGLTGSSQSYAIITNLASPSGKISSNNRPPPRGRRPPGWGIRTNDMPAGLLCDALRMAINQRRPTPNLIFPLRLRQAVTHRRSSHGCRPGTGSDTAHPRPRPCWDNAVIESFYSTLKVELVHRHVWPTRVQAEQGRLRVHRSIEERRSSLLAQPPKPVPGRPRLCFRSRFLHSATGSASSSARSAGPYPASRSPAPQLLQRILVRPRPGGPSNANRLRTALLCLPAPRSAAVCLAPTVERSQRRI